MSAATTLTKAQFAPTTVAAGPSQGDFELLRGPSNLSVETTLPLRSPEPLYLTPDGSVDLNRCSFIGVRDALGWVAAD